MKKSIVFLVAIYLLMVSSSLNGQTSFRPDKSDYKKADKILRKMSLDEKIGQLIHIGINARFLNLESAEFRNLRRQVTENKVGGIIVFVGGVYETVHLVNRMQEAAEIPLLISADFETGVGMRFFETINLPWNMAIAATGDPEFARKAGVITAREARAMGVQQVFAPVADVNNNAENPVINVRSFGENPLDVARFSTAFSVGLQSGNVLATAKHFPGHGNTSVDSHRGLPVIDFSRDELEQIEFLPFRSLIVSGVGSVMISHISMPQLDSESIKPLENRIPTEDSSNEVVTEAVTVPATLSKRIVTGILRDEMKFDGLIATDALDMSGLTLYFSPEEAAVRAILAGNDMLIKPADTDAAINGIRKAVASGRIKEERIDESVKRILGWKHRLGLFRQKITPIETIDRIVSSPETQNLTDEIAQKAITLVKYDESILPVKADRKAVVLCITNGNDLETSGRTFVNSLRANGLEVERVALDQRSTENEINAAVEKALNADIVFAGLFGRVRSGARNSIGISEAGEKALRKILKSDVPTVSIAFGNPYLILNFPEMRNYVVAYGDMVSLQKAAADAVMGKAGFYGKLPITIGEHPRGTGLSLVK